MNYIGNVIRPPSEADSIILQVTVGCSYNRCTFCGAYKDVAFQVKADETIETDLAFAKKYCSRQQRVFLADGDVLILSQNRLVELFRKIRQYLPWVSKISLYANARAIKRKSIDQLLQLKLMGLHRIYMGLESGCDEVLLAVKKGETSESMIAAAKKIRQTGIFLSVTTLLGLGGEKLSTHHAIETANVLGKMAPQQIAVLTLMPLDNTALGQQVITGSFTLPAPSQTLRELHQLLYHLPDIRCQFHANHASSYLPLAGRLPRDKETMLSSLELAMKGATSLVPECRRAL